MQAEIFREIQDRPLYEISNYGKIRNWNKRNGKRDFPKYLNPFKDSNGYFLVDLCKGAPKKTRLVHRLVLEVFEGPCPKGMEGLHKDGIPENIYVENLKWGTRKENVADSIRHGTFARGSRQGSSRLKEADIPIIRELSKKHNLSYSKICKRFGVKEMAIHRVVKRKTWRHIE